MIVMVSAGRVKGSMVGNSGSLEASPSWANLPQQINTGQRFYAIKICHFCFLSVGVLLFVMVVLLLCRESAGQELVSHLHCAPMARVSSDKVC